MPPGAAVSIPRTKAQKDALLDLILTQHLRRPAWPPDGARRLVGAAS